MVDVFTNASSRPVCASDLFVPQAGALVMTRPSRDEVPDVVHAQEVVNCHGNAFPPDGRFPQWPEGHDCTLLLGVVFEQMLVRHVGEEREVELAAAYDTSVDDAVLFFSHVGFEQMAFRGFPVQHLAAIRTHSMHGRAVRGYGVFIDLRDLGRPVCFRLFRTRTVTVEMLLRAVDVEMPTGVEAMMEGNDVTGQELFVPDEGTAVSLCAGFVFTDMSAGSSDDPSVPHDNDDEAAEDPDSDEVHRATSFDGAGNGDRSRSPPP